MNLFAGLKIRVIHKNNNTH